MGRYVIRTLIALLGIVLALGLVLISIVYVQGNRRPTGDPQYVALGSSYASGPGLTPHASGSPFLCGRSDRNYAHLLARRRGLSLVDMTCAGATTEHVLHGGQYFQAAQIDAITPRTRLVTITAGGNDVFYLGNLTALSCGTQRSVLETALGACRSATADAVAKGFARLEQNLRSISIEVHRRAPMARVLFVTYLTVLPRGGTCDRLGLDASGADRMRVVAARLAETTTRVAKATGAEVVDAATLSGNHDVCAVDPWLNGRRPPALLSAPLHPNVEGMQRVADMINRSLSQVAAS